MSVSGLQADVKAGHAPCWCAQQWPSLALSGPVEPLVRVGHHFESYQAQQAQAKAWRPFLQCSSIYIVQCRVVPQCHSIRDERLASLTKITKLNKLKVVNGCIPSWPCTLATPRPIYSQLSFFWLRQSQFQEWAFPWMSVKIGVSFFNPNKFFYKNLLPHKYIWRGLDFRVFGFSGIDNCVPYRLYRVMGDTPLFLP